MNKKTYVNDNKRIPDLNYIKVSLKILLQMSKLLRTCNKICNEWDQRHSNNSNTFIINEYNLHTRSE